MKSRKNRTQTKKTAAPLLIQDNIDVKWPDYAAKILLLGFGAWMSVYYFGFLASPNPDFPCFTQLARELFSLHLPSSYKRVPVHGFLVVLLSVFTKSSPHPDLTAGWAVCAILYPFTILLVYLLAKQFIGRWAIWPALICAVQPWVVQSLVDPIAEMTLLFFILLTFYFIFKRSRWAYLFAAITSMVRYEGAALILAAFVWDMLEAKNWRQREKAFAFSAAASVPLMLWAIGTIMNLQREGGHYLNEMGEEGKFVFVKFIKMMWDSGFAILFLPAKGTSWETTQLLFKINGIVLATGFGFGTIYGLFKRNWKVLMLLIFLLPYICIHAVHSFVLARFAVPVHWIVLLIAMYGFYSLFHLLNGDERIPKLLIVAVQVITVICFALWFFGLLPYLTTAASWSPHSVPILYVLLSIAVVFIAISAFTQRIKYLRADIVALVVFAVVVVSNQYCLAERIVKGDLDVEFKHLAEWYRSNAKPGELLVTTLPGNCALYDPKHSACYIHTGAIDANSPAEFANQCSRKNITYVAWDSRIGAAKGDRYYDSWHLENTAQLAAGKSVEPYYEYITTLEGSKMYRSPRVIHIYRLKKPGS